MEGRRGWSRTLEHEHVGGTAVVDEDAVSRELVAGVSECDEEGVGECLLENAARGVEELAQGWSRDVLHEEEVGVAERGVCESDNAVEDGCGTYAEACDAQMEGDLGVDDALETDFGSRRRGRGVLDVEDVVDALDGRVAPVEADAEDGGCAADRDEFSGCVVEAQRALCGLVYEDVEWGHVLF